MMLKLPHFQTKIVWESVFGFVILHVLTLLSLYLMPGAKLATFIFTAFLAFFSALGITAGAHRLWSHRSYKARLPLRIFLMLGNTVAIQKPVIEWTRDHRVHHKYSETDSDPYNANRGFFFSHIGWLMCRKHPDVKIKGKNLDISDLEADPVLRFQRQYYIPLIIVFSMVLPTAIPVLFWQENALVSFLICFIFRFVYILHVTFMVNSVAHMWGNRPYDKSISPRENRVIAWFSFGEGFHNYHHTFPWDYSTSEFGLKLNPTTLFINVMAFLGQAYDLKTVDPQIVQQRALRTGEHSHNHHHHDE